MTERRGIYLDGGDDPTFADVDAFLQGSFAAHAVYDSDINKTAISIIDQHIPSLTDEDDEAMTLYASTKWASEEFDYADLAIRTCACGVRIDGFYEYAAHLKAMLAP